MIFIVSQLLHRLADEATRTDLLTQLLPHAKSVYLAIRFALRIDPESSRDAAGWSVDTVKALRPIVLDRIRTCATSGDLAAVPYLDTVFNVWETLGDRGRAKGFRGRDGEVRSGGRRPAGGDALKPIGPGEVRFKLQRRFPQPSGPRSRFLRACAQVPRLAAGEARLAGPRSGTWPSKRSLPPSAAPPSRSPKVRFSAVFSLR